MPILQKLQRYVDTNPKSEENTLYEYKYSSIEMLREQTGASCQVIADYNLGMKTNLVDRDIYKFGDNQ